MHHRAAATARHEWVHPAALAAVVSVIMLMAGCGGDSPAPGGGGAPAGGGPTAPAAGAIEDSCDLFSREEAAAAAGNPVKEGKLLGIVCIWEPEDLSNDTHLQVSVALLSFPPGGDAAAMCQAGLPGIPDAKPLPGAGVGNAAYWDFGSGGRSNTGSLHVCFDRGTLDTSAIGLRPEAELQQIAVSMAKTALGRV